MNIKKFDLEARQVTTIRAVSKSDTPTMSDEHDTENPPLETILYT